MTIVDQICGYVESLRYEDLPEDVIFQAKRLITDTMGCGLGGYFSQPAEIAREIALTLTSQQPVSLLGCGRQTSPDMATFANGVAIRYLDFNDGYTSRGESGHPSDSIAAALAIAELMHSDGREFIVAVVLAYEVFCRICDTVDLKPLGFDHVTVGGMASATAAARLLGFRGNTLRHALNLAIAPNIALYQTRIGHVSMWKGCAYANASRNAVFACMLAQRGMTGPSPIFEGVGGYFKAVTRESFQLSHWGDNNHRFKIMECSIKRFPLGQYSQTVVEAALEVRRRIASVDEISGVRIETVTTAIRLMAGDPDKWEPETRETADHSMPYTVAVALLHGSVEKEHFEQAYLQDQHLRALTRLVKIKATAEADSKMPDAMFCRLWLETKSGQTYEAMVEYHRGHWRNPMSDEQVSDKFRLLSKQVLTPKATELMLDCLSNLEHLPDMGKLLKLTIS